MNEEQLLELLQQKKEFARISKSVKPRRTAMSEIKYEILQQVGVLSTTASGWSKQLNLISWNDREPKYDLRDWSADRSKTGKGATLSRDELLALKELLNSIEL